MGFLMAMRLRMEAWKPLLDMNRIEHGVMLPIQHYWFDLSGQPMLGLPCEGPETEEFARTAYQDPRRCSGDQEVLDAGNSARSQRSTLNRCGGSQRLRSSSILARYLHMRLCT
jgi:hypothetical protein